MAVVYIEHTMHYELTDTNFAVNTSESPRDHYGQHEFVTEKPWVAIPIIIILCVSSVLGSLGNCLILVAVATHRALRDVEAIFIVNLALSDLYVTMVADPFSIVGKLEGVQFFDGIPGLCETVASVCTISCVTSVLTISMMSVNRYFCICKQDLYKRLFTKLNCVISCVILYLIGLIIVLLNTVGIGDHQFDHKSLECIWDRMATHPYTIVFTVIIVWLPGTITGVCYLKIFLFVREHRRKVVEHQSESTVFSNKVRLKNFRLAKALFIIYAIFMTCWVPYALVIALDSENQFAHELHLFVSMFAHLHPSMNWLIYYWTNKKFHDAYRDLLNQCGLCRLQTGNGGSFFSSQGQNNNIHSERSNINELIDRALQEKSLKQSSENRDQDANNASTI